MWLILVQPCAVYCRYPFNMCFAAVACPTVRCLRLTFVEQIFRDNAPHAPSTCYMNFLRRQILCGNKRVTYMVDTRSTLCCLLSIFFQYVLLCGCLSNRALPTANVCATNVSHQRSTRPVHLVHRCLKGPDLVRTTACGVGS